LSRLGRWRYGLISAILVIADQATKSCVDGRPQWGREPLVVLSGYFEIVSWRNPGMMFSMLLNAPDPWRRIFLTAVPLAAVGVIVYLMSRIGEQEHFSLAGFALVLGGAAGNILDRFLRGSVVDFLRFGIGYEPVRRWLEGTFGTSWWPAFNLADSAICIGAAAIAIETLRSTRSSRSPAPGTARSSG